MDRVRRALGSLDLHLLAGLILLVAAVVLLGMIGDAHGILGDVVGRNDALLMTDDILLVAALHAVAATAVMVLRRGRAAGLARILAGEWALVGFVVWAAFLGILVFGYAESRDHVLKLLTAAGLLTAYAVAVVALVVAHRRAMAEAPLRRP